MNRQMNRQWLGLIALATITVSLAATPVMAQGKTPDGKRLPSRHTVHTPGSWPRR